MQLTSKEITRFWRKVSKLGPDDCWQWLGPTRVVGERISCTFYFGPANHRQGIVARRLAILLEGGDIGSAQIINTCGNEHCVNPRHHQFKRKELIEYPLTPGYNREQRNEFPLSTESDAFLGALAPLRFGKTVVLTMEDPRFKAIKNYRGTKGTKLVVLVPGSAMEMKGVVLVSVLGAGSCMVRLNSTQVADLVLAGMPARLASVLMQKLHRIFQE